MFVPDSIGWADEAMAAVDPSLRGPFTTVVRFLAAFPEAAARSRGRNAPEPGSKAYLARQAEAFAAARRLRAPSAPTTVPDPMVSVVVRDYFGVVEVERAQREHLLSMGAENAIGDLLERYLAAVIEPLGWAWCSGSMVRAVDFIKPPPVNGEEQWELLQVKNRDNSENSSSSAIRSGTEIRKWHRTFSRRPETNWPAFPDTAAARLLSEDAFVAFVQDYLARVRAAE